MAYNVTTQNGANFSVLPNTLDTSNTSLSIPGKNYSGWGQPYASNFTKLVENFAGPTAPVNSRRGQIWFNTNSNTLQVYIANAYSDINAINADHATIADTANALTTPRSITLDGDVTGSTIFDGTANVTITVSIDDIPGGGAIANAGPYQNPTLTVDSKGRITSISSGVINSVVAPSAGVTSFQGRFTANAILTGADVNSALTYIPLDSNSTVFVKKTGDTMSGTLNMGMNPISMAGNITTYGNLRMATAGMQTDFATNRLQNVGAPQVSTDGATKGYVDGRLSGGGSGGSVTVSTQPPSGGSNGDVWYRY